MSISAIVEVIKGASKEARRGLATQNIKAFVEFGDNLNEQMGGSIDFRGMAANLFALAVGADGSLDQDEYDVYEEICQDAGIEPQPYSTCQSFANAPSEAIDMFKEVIGSLKNIFDEEIYKNFAYGLACMMLEDDELTCQEERLLSLFTGDEVGSSISESNFSSQAATEEVKVVTYQGNISRKDDRYYFTIGAEIKNPNVAHCARNVSVKVIVKDSTGRILESSQNTIDYIDSNGTFYYGDEFSIDRGEPANYSIQVNCDDYVSAPENSSFASGITCSHYKLNNDRWGTIEFTGNVNNGYNKRLYIELYFVFYDGAGKISGGTNTRVNLYGNSDDVFESYLYTNINRENVRCSASFDFMELID